VTTQDLDWAQAELQALGDHYATTHQSPALIWGVMLDGQLAVSGHSGTLDDGAALTTRTGISDRLDDEDLDGGDGPAPAR
jgi:hypothetical protein